MMNILMQFGCWNKPILAQLMNLGHYLYKYWALHLAQLGSRKITKKKQSPLGHIFRSSLINGYYCEVLNFKGETLGHYYKISSGHYSYNV